MKTSKHPKLWQRLGVKALKKELRPCEPISNGSRAGVGHCLTQDSEYAATPCFVCARPLSFGRLTACDRNPNVAGGQWAMAHLACGARWLAGIRNPWLARIGELGPVVMAILKEPEPLNEANQWIADHAEIKAANALSLKHDWRRPDEDEAA